MRGFRFQEGGKSFSRWEKVAFRPDEGQMLKGFTFISACRGVELVSTAPSSVCCAATFSRREKGFPET